MIETQAPLWVYGSGTLELHVSAPGRVTTRVWVDGDELEPVEFSGTETFSVELRVPRWHSVLLEVERLFPTKPPSGLRLERLVLRPPD